MSALPITWPRPESGPSPFSSSRLSALAKLSSVSGKFGRCPPALKRRVHHRERVAPHRRRNVQAPFDQKARLLRQCESTQPERRQTCVRRTRVPIRIPPSASRCSRNSARAKSSTVVILILVFGLATILGFNPNASTADASSVTVLRV